MLTYDLLTGKEILLDKKEFEIELNPHFVQKSGDTMTGDLLVQPIVEELQKEEEKVVKEEKK